MKIFRKQPTPGRSPGFQGLKSTSSLRLKSDPPVRLKTAAPVETRADLDRAILPIRLRLMRMLSTWARDIVLGRSQNAGKVFLFDVPNLRVGSNQPFSLIYPEPRLASLPGAFGQQKQLIVSALVWVGSLHGSLRERGDGDSRSRYLRTLTPRIPFSRLDLHPHRDSLPAFAAKATLVRQCGVIREGYGESDIDIYVEGKYDSEAKPKGILFRVEQSVSAPVPKTNGQIPVDSATEIPKILNGRPLIMQIEKDLRARGLIPPGAEFILQMRREPNRLDEIEAVGLAYKTNDLGELNLAVPAQEFDLALAIRQHLSTPINQLRPGIFVPHLFAGALEPLAFDFVPMGPHHFSFQLQKLRQIQGHDKIQFEKLVVPQTENGTDRTHYSDGQTVDEAGVIVNKTSIPSSALFKLAILMRQDPVLPNHLSPGQMGIVFSDFKLTKEPGKIVKEFFLEFVPRKDRNIVYAQTGEKAAPLNAAETETVINYLRKYVPRNIKITPQFDAAEHLLALDVVFQVN